MTRHRAGWLASAAVVAISLVPAAANAQEARNAVTADSQSTSYPEQTTDVVVTARGREERLQDVPLQVNVVSEESIRRQGLKDILDLTRQAPSFNYQATQRGQGTISMRGLNPNTFNVFRQGVSFFIDGIYIPGEVTSLNLQDLERAEVLKGPQATQFGRGTYAGAVNYVTRTPSSNEARGRIDAEVFTYGGHDVNGYVAFPIVSDQLFAELSARHFERGNRYYNRNDGEGVGNQRSVNFAGIVHWTPASETSVKLRFSHDYDDDANPAQFSLLPHELARFNQTFPNRAYPVFTLNFRRPDIIGYGDSLFDGYGDRDGNRIRERNVVALIASQGFGDGYSIRYSGNYYREETKFNQDVGNRWLGDPTLTNPRPFLVSQRQRFEATTQELRLQSPTDQPFTWMIGGNYYYINYRAFAPGNLAFFPIISYVTVPGVNQQNGTLTNREIAGFGSASYAFFDKFRLTLEGRYQSVKLALDRCLPTQCLALTGDFSRTQNNFLPRVTLDYKPNDNALIYALFSQGVKNGAINTPAAAATEQAFATFANANYQRPERASNYEVGFKLGLFNGALDLNGAAYLTKVRDQQVTTFDVTPAGLVLVTGNGGTSTIKGGEFTLSGRLTPNWTVNAGVGYADHTFTSRTATNSILTGLFGINDPRASLRGRTSVLTPEWTGNFSTEYAIPLGDEKLVSLRADYTYRGREFVDIPNLITLPEIHRLGVSIRFDVDNYAFTLFARNVLDDRKPDDAVIGNGNLTEQGSPRYFQTPSVTGYLPYGRIIGARTSLRF